MVIYELTLLPLSQFLRERTPAVIQSFYADDLSFSGYGSEIQTAMKLLLKHEPSIGYFPELAKLIVVCTESDENHAKQVLDEFQFVYKRGSQYIGGFIGTTACLTKWIDEQVEFWVRGIKLLSRAATKRLPQTTFAALTCSLQTEWPYPQQVVPDVSTCFAPIEKALAKSFLPALFGGKSPTL